MKKLSLTLIFCFFLSTFALADGEIPTSGKTCTGTCLTTSTSELPTEPKETIFSTIFKTLFEILN